MIYCVSLKRYLKNWGKEGHDKPYQVFFKSEQKISKAKKIKCTGLKHAEFITDSRFSTKEKQLFKIRKDVKQNVGGLKATLGVLLVVYFKKFNDICSNTQYYTTTFPLESRGVLSLIHFVTKVVTNIGNSKHFCIIQQKISPPRSKHPMQNFTFLGQPLL